MDEMYEIVEQAKYRYLGIDEMYKIGDGWNVLNGRYLRSLNMNTPEFALSQL